MPSKNLRLARSSTKRPGGRVAFVATVHFRGYPRRTPRSYPESWVFLSTGIAWARVGRTSMTVLDEELIQGPRAATETIRALERADLIVGHGLLNTDLRSVAMMTPVPDELADRCVDPYLILENARRDRRRTGLDTLAYLAHATLGPTPHDHAYGTLPDPRPVARLTLRLWRHLVTHRSFTPSPALGKSPCPQAVDDETYERLTGRVLMGATAWNEHRQSGLVLPGRRPVAAAAALAAAADTTWKHDLTPLHRAVEPLLDDDPRRSLPVPLLMSALQRLRPPDNLAARRALGRGTFADSAARTDRYREAFARVVNAAHIDFGPLSLLAG
ncbi:hypothetical protein [Streptomyces sp. NPDC002215]|uniref:hypothetical protein n=1 Tax=Streptomyces sp. NPDC002215 TaxID=3154412 RepID=UPI0033339358